MKERKVWDEVHAFLLLCLCQLYIPTPPHVPLHYSLPTVALAAPSGRKVGPKSFALFEVSVRDTGSNRRKKLIRLSLIPSPALFVPLPLKSFVLNLLDRLYSFHEQKPHEKRHPAWLENKSNYFFSACLSHNKQETLHLLPWIVRTVSSHLEYNKFSYHVSPWRHINATSLHISAWEENHSGPAINFVC